PGKGPDAAVSPLGRSRPLSPRRAGRVPPRTGAGLTAGTARSYPEADNNKMPRRRCNAPGPAKEAEAPMRAQGTRPRRVKTRYEGVYKARSGNYEIAYRASDRKLRFQVVTGTAKEAAAARAAIMAKIGKGETVRLSRQTFRELAEVWFEGKANRLRPKTR